MAFRNYMSRGCGEALRESGRLLKAVNYNNNSGLAPQESFGGFTRE